jgi:hypothetical protein
MSFGAEPYRRPAARAKLLLVSEPGQGVAESNTAPDEPLHAPELLYLGVPKRSVHRPRRAMPAGLARPLELPNRAAQ